MIEVVVAVGVFLSACYSIFKDLPQARRNMCQIGKTKCRLCIDRFRCYTNR